LVCRARNPHGFEQYSISRGPPSGDARPLSRCRGGVDFLGDRGLAGRCRLRTSSASRCSFYDHGAATHRKGACCAGRDIHDARAVAERVGIPHYVLDYERRFKEAVIGPFSRRATSPAKTAGAVRGVQSVDQISRPAVETARELGARGVGDRPLVASRALAETGSRALYSRLRDRARPSAISCSPRRARNSNSCAFRSATAPKAETRGTGPPLRASVADKQDSQDICFVRAAIYAGHDRTAAPGCGRAGRKSYRPRRPRARPITTGIIHFTVGQRRGASASQPLAALCCAARCRPAPCRGRSA